MAEPKGPPPEHIGWIELTAPDAAAVRDFCQDMTGWTSSGPDMDGYQDFRHILVVAAHLTDTRHRQSVAVSSAAGSCVNRSPAWGAWAGIA
jgi:hypothetical protein